MGDWWPAVSPDLYFENREISSVSGATMSPLGLGGSVLLSRACAGAETFCTERNVPQCVSYINQEVSSLGLGEACVELSRPKERGLGAVSALNVLYELLQRLQRGQRTLHELEAEQLRSGSALEHSQIGNTRLKDQLEQSRRENDGLLEAERRLQLRVRSLQGALKTEKEEVQKLQSIISSRACQYSHDSKRKERECAKLKERLNQLLTDKRDRKLAIDILNYLGRSDGKRSQWKTGKMDTRHETDMYGFVLGEYEGRQLALALENAELKKVLQQMKREMVSILSPKKPASKGDTVEDGVEKVCLGTDETLDSSRESMEQSCEEAREQLTNSIRQQWRRLKSHVERLDSQASVGQGQEEQEVISRSRHEEEMQRVNLEVQQCRDFIQIQQQLLQQQLVSPCDDETALLLSDCYALEEKERLKEEWRLFHEQRRTFERERGSFTEAAIRLGHERMAFEEEKASWLKTQFLNMTPFVERGAPPHPESQGALSISSEPGLPAPSTPAQVTKAHSYSSVATPRPSMPSTLELYRTLSLLPDTSSSGGVSKRWGRSASRALDSGDSVSRSRHRRHRAGDRSFFTSVGDQSSPS